VIFPVIANGKDSLEAKNKLEAIKTKYKEATNDSLFVTANSGKYQDIYVKKAKMEGIMKDTAWDLPVGTIFGPYIENGAYMLSKIIDKKMVPDSVRSRHILIQAKTPGDIAKANKTIDSLKIVIETGKNNFDTLASKFGQDASRAKGGDLGFVPQGGMIKEYNNLIFYKAVPHKLYKLTTQYGVHLIEVTALKYTDTNPGIKISSFREPIVPGDDTQAAAEDRANQFLTQNRTLDEVKKSTKELKNLEVIKSIPLKAHDYSLGTLGSSEGSYSIVKWAFTGGAKVGDVSPTLYSFKNQQEFYTDKYVVAALSTIQKPGLPDLDYIKEDVKVQVMYYKKGEMLKAKINSKDLNSIASSFKTKIDTAKGVNFASPFIAGIGNEIKVIVSAMKLELNTTSDPILGSVSLIIVKPINRTNGEIATNIAEIKNNTRKQAEQQVGPKVMEALRKTYKIKDDRYKFFN
jgi:peptidyl-prolyl cis-trans isomerase D